MAENRHFLRALCGLSLLLSLSFGCTDHDLDERVSSGAERPDEERDGGAAASDERTRSCSGGAAPQPVNHVRVLAPAGKAKGLVGARARTAFTGATEGGSYVGLDLAGTLLTAAPTFTPPPGNFEQGPAVTITSTTPGAHVRYTTDGSEPSRTTGTPYAGPFTPESRANVKAIAYADCLFDSPVSSGRYGIGQGGAIERGLKTYHLGNSLTDTINPWLEPIADSTGVDHQYARWTIPGAPISWLAAHQGDGFGTPEGAQSIRAFAASFAPIDHVSLQPFTNPSLNDEGGAAVQLLQPVLAASPDVQVWIYAQWPERDQPGQTAPYLKSSLATGAPWADPPWTVARQPTSWEEATLNQESYHEAFRAWLDERIPGKPVRVVPGGRGLVLLKRAIEHGEVPGIRTFFDQHFSDELHLSTKGQYMVALVFYAALYGRSPEGIVTHEGTGLTPAQARVYQQLAAQAANR